MQFARPLVVALALAYVGLALVPTASASVTAAASQGGVLGLAGNEVGVVASPGTDPSWRVDADTAVAKLVHLGPLDYVLEVVTSVVEAVRSGGLNCVYDAGSDRESLVCYCLELTWDCDGDIVLKWTCYASVGPTTNNQVGLVCLPPRTQILA